MDSVTSLSQFKVETVPLSDIDHEDKTFQYRTNEASEDLQESLAADGQQQAVELVGTSPPYRILDGFRRVLALRALGAGQVIVHIYDLSEEDAHKAAFIKNVVRKNLTAGEQANAILLAIRRGRKSDDIARDLGLSKRQILRYKAYLNLPPAIRRHVDEGSVKIAHLQALTTGKVNQREWPKWIKHVLDEEWSARRLTRELKQVQAHEQEAKSQDPVRIDDRGVYLSQTAIEFTAARKKRQELASKLMAAAQALIAGEG
jgi:ParB/RepB/Spo0J family partition protein